MQKFSLRYTENCTQCFPEYFKEDFFSEKEPETFHCFRETEYQGVEEYHFNKSLEVDGVQKMIDGKGLCYNCRLREGNYR